MAIFLINFISLEMNEKIINYLREFEFFKHVLKTTKVCDGKIGAFCVNNGVGSRSYGAWKYHGVPKTIRYALMKEIEMQNLLVRLKGTDPNNIITQDMVLNSYEEMKSKA
jgi:hypothetical protein